MFLFFRSSLFDEGYILILVFVAILKASILFLLFINFIHIKLAVNIFGVIIFTLLFITFLLNFETLTVMKSIFFVILFKL